ncbi:MAG: HK97 family phage prohead protease [Ahrensia sp.]|nr:HK97 family phage prohead protease [Ahrensia sp.]
MRSKDRNGLDIKRISVPLDKVTRDGTFSGYASLFDKVDLGRDKIARGAFAASLSRRGIGGIRMLFQHDPAEPIGAWSRIAEDEQGLFVEGRIVGSHGRAAQTLELLRAGAVDGLSIGFKTERSRTDPKTGIRTILQADLWEVSIVTFPMLPQARVETVKQIGDAAALTAKLRAATRNLKSFNRKKSA